jgi:hypothetical protein
VYLPSRFLALRDVLRSPADAADVIKHLHTLGQLQSSYSTAHSVYAEYASTPETQAIAQILENSKFDAHNIRTSFVSMEAFFDKVFDSENEEDPELSPTLMRNCFYIWLELKITKETSQ